MLISDWCERQVVLKGVNKLEVLLKNVFFLSGVCVQKLAFPVIIKNNYLFLKNKHGVNNYEMREEMAIKESTILRWAHFGFSKQMLL